MATSWVIIAGLIPSLLLICLGYVVKSLFNEAFWSQLERFIYYVFFPALLFISAAKNPIALSDVVILAPAAWGLMTIGLITGYLLRHMGPESDLDFAGLWQTTWRFNTFLTLIAVAAIPGLEPGFMAITVGIAIPVANIFAVTALARGQAAQRPLDILKKVAANPLLIGSFSGFLVGVLHIPKPALLMDAISLAGQPALPLALLCLGAALRFDHVRRLNGFVSSFHAIKLLLLPTCAVLFSLLFQIPSQIAATLIIFAAVPTATAALILASTFGANKTMVASQIAQSTVFGVITLPFWMLVAAHFLTH